jgi:DNA mismatch repair protein MutS2
MKDDRPVNKDRGVSATGVAGTPSSFSGVSTPAALDALEFEVALDVVARHAVSEIGAESVRSRVPSGSVDWVISELATATEFQRLLDSGDPFRPEAVQDIRAVLESLEIEGNVLEPTELLAVGAASEAMRNVLAGLERIAAEAPRLSSLAVELPQSAIGRSIDRALDPDGAVKDDASPELSRARRGVRDTRARLVALLEKQMRSLGQSAGHAEVTLKSGRYVIPVRRDDRDRVRGIVHGESSSGTTLFVEPPEAVELGNELNGWESEEARAVLAVLRDLTEMIRPHRFGLAAGLEMCRCVDDAYARARFAIECDSTQPQVVDRERALCIVRGAHPLLVAAGENAVPFDLHLSGDEHTLLVSGPNAGGKTVLLKAVGLICSMAQSGIIPPVGKGTSLPIYGTFFVDIGDHQSIAASLSTFSAHVAALREILERADAAALVLVDELGGGTDPIEGAALAGATLLSLNDRACTTVATTHLTELKELAAKTEGVVNGSLEFDIETLAPTYQFIKDRPGRSFGLAIARRLGVPDDVLARAEELQPKEARSLEAMLADLEQREQQLRQREEQVSLDAARLAKESEAVTRLRETLDSRDLELAAREKQAEREGREQARRFLLDARRRVEQALGVARATVTEATAKEARRLVEEGVREEADALKRLEAGGWKVKSGELGAGSWERKRTSEFETDSAPRALETDPHTAPSSELPEIDDAQTEIDLRGMTGEEAEAVLILAIDSAVAADLPWMRIIHGKGTGALRSRVAQVVQRDRRVARSNLAPPEQGGTGVTLVEFRS